MKAVQSCVCVLSFFWQRVGMKFEIRDECDGIQFRRRQASLEEVFIELFARLLVKRERDWKQKKTKQF